MIIYTFAAACILGLLRWPVWTVLVLAVATLIGYLGVGAGWDPNVWQPYNNPIFVDLVMKLALSNVVACTIGYGIGRLVAFGWRRLTRG